MFRLSTGFICLFAGAAALMLPAPFFQANVCAAETVPEESAASADEAGAGNLNEGCEIAYSAEDLGGGEGALTVTGFTAWEDEPVVVLPDEFEGLKITRLPAGSLSALADHHAAVTFPADLKVIEEGALTGAVISDISLTSSDERYTLEDGCLIDEKNQTLLYVMPGTAGAYYKIPEEIKTIGAGAFCGCGKINRLVLPSGLSSVSAGAFAGAEIKAFWISEDNKRFETDRGILFRKGQYAVTAWPSGRDTAYYVVPETVDIIENEAFAGAKYLRYLSFPDNLTFIGNRAFAQCQSLRRINIPEGITAIGYEAFADDTALTFAEFGGGGELSGISPGMFEGCSQLTELVIPEGVNYICSRAFARCSALKKIDLPHSLNVIEDEVFAECEALLEVEIPPAVSKIEPDSFDEGSPVLLKVAGDSAALAYAMEHGFAFETEKAEWEEGVSYTDYATVSRVQQALADLKYETGKIDGLIGRRTRAAIKAFRSDHHLPEGEEIDAQLLNALDLKAAAPAETETETDTESGVETETETGTEKGNKTESEPGSGIENRAETGAENKAEDNSETGAGGEPDYGSENRDAGTDMDGSADGWVLPGDEFYPEENMQDAVPDADFGEDEEMLTEDPSWIEEEMYQPAFGRSDYDLSGFMQSLLAEFITKEGK